MKTATKVVFVKLLSGILLSVYWIMVEPTNRNERRQAKKTGSFRRNK